MDSYWLFFKTVVHTVASLLSAAVMLFTSGPPADPKPAAPPAYLRAAFGVSEQGQEPAASQDQQRAVVDALVEALKDSDAGVRRHAATALGEIGSTRAVDGLIAALADRQSDVRSTAAIALGELGDPRAIEALMRALKDSDPGVRRCAVIAIAELSGDQSGTRGGHPRPRPQPRRDAPPSGV